MSYDGYAYGLRDTDITIAGLAVQVTTGVSVGVQQASGMGLVVTVPGTVGGGDGNAEFQVQTSPRLPQVLVDAGVTVTTTWRGTSTKKSRIPLSGAIETHNWRLNGPILDNVRLQVSPDSAAAAGTIQVFWLSDRPLSSL